MSKLQAGPDNRASGQKFSLAGGYSGTGADLERVLESQAGVKSRESRVSVRAVGLTPGIVSYSGRGT